MAVVIGSSGSVEVTVPLVRSDVIAPKANVLEGLAQIRSIISDHIQNGMQHNELSGRTDAAAHPADAIEVNTASFDGILDAEDDDLQKVVDKIDKLAGYVLPLGLDLPPAGPLQGDDNFVLVERSMLVDDLESSSGMTIDSLMCYWIEVELKCVEAGDGKPVVKLIAGNESELGATPVPQYGEWTKVTRYNDVPYWTSGPDDEGGNILYVGLDSELDELDQVGFQPSDGTVVFRYTFKYNNGNPNPSNEPFCLIETSNLSGSGEQVEVTRVRAGSRWVANPLG